MQATFTIRDVEVQELPLLAALELRAAERFRATPHAYAADLPPFDPSQLAERARAGCVWVAVDAVRVRGFAIAGQLGGAAYLHELDVEPEYGRRGAGRALVRRVAAWANDERRAQLVLSTFSDVPWNAPFYAKLGFEIVPVAAYDDAMRRLRQSEGELGLVIERRVIMSAPLDRLLSPS